ncbi:hypothetical protein HRbin28_01627 [bacterium HR28]|nr:hypothetical protein HRbin28_01627 [bacterium HR28]
MATEVLRALREKYAREQAREKPWIEYPARIPHIELLGRMPDSAFDQEQWLVAVRGQHFALTPILYRILEEADGRTSAAEIAERVSHLVGRELSAADVRWLIEHRLIPAGLIQAGRAETRQAEAAEERSRPLLKIRARVPLLQPQWIAPLTGILQYLFWRPVAIVALALIGFMHLWIYTAGTSALGEATRLLFIEPRWILLVFAMEIGASLFHEFGHAAAMRRSRCPHGPIGFGIYLIWPVFFTDVTPIYRLRRSERLRVDLGGMYFHQIAALAFMALYAASGWPLWLLGVIIADVQCLRQLNPFFRFDGYYVLADLLGIPDPLSHIRPYLQSLFRRGSYTGLRLRRTTHLLFAGYLGLVAIYFILPYAFGIQFGKEVIQTIWLTGVGLQHALVAAWEIRDALLLAAVAVQAFFWLLSVLGLALFCWTAFSLTGLLLRRLFAFGRPWHRVAGRHR